MKLINIHDVEVAISAWVSHVMPHKFNTISVMQEDAGSIDIQNCRSSGTRRSTCNSVVD